MFGIREKKKEGFEVWVQSKETELQQAPECFRFDVEQAKVLLSEALIADMGPLVTSYLDPVCATECELADLYANKASVQSVVRSLMADTRLSTDGYHVRGVKNIVVGPQSWSQFLASAQSADGNVLAALFATALKKPPPTKLLMEIIPANGKDKAQLFAFGNSLGNLTGIAATRDFETKTRWRTELMRSMAPSVTRSQRHSRFQGFLPIHNLILALARSGKTAFHYFDFKWFLLRILPADVKMRDLRTGFGGRVQSHVPGDEDINFNQWVLNACGNADFACKIIQVIYETIFQGPYHD